MYKIKLHVLNSVNDGDYTTEYVKYSYGDITGIKKVVWRTGYLDEYSYSIYKKIKEIMRSIIYSKIGNNFRSVEEKNSNRIMKSIISSIKRMK